MPSKNKSDRDIIDDDLYEDIDDEEMEKIVREAQRETLEKKRTESRQRGSEKTKRPFPRWAFWFIAIAMVFNLFAVMPQTISIPAIDFLMTSAKLSTQEDIQAYKKSVAVVETDDGRGTGFSVDEDGTVLTNHHVVEGNDMVTIAFPDEGLFDGEVVDVYPDIDLAIVDPVDTDGDMPHLDVASSTSSQAGEPVYFIGNPLHFNGIANKGTIIGDIGLSGWNEKVVMMDAPVYRGNSGSPVINMEGEAIGIVFATQKTDEHGKVGLFVPIDYYWKFVDK